MTQEHILIQIETTESGTRAMTTQDFANGRLRMPPEATSVRNSPSRAEDTVNLTENLPAGMFDIDNDTLTYRGYPQAWLENLVGRVKRAAAVLTAGNAAAGIRGILKETGSLGPAYVVMEKETMPLDLWLLGTAEYAEKGDTYVIRQTLRYL